MRTTWFGDNRDIVKWSALLHIAKRHHISIIAQICFLNRHNFPRITIDGTSLKIPPDVLKHFRSLRSVERLTNKVTIKVFDSPLTDRESYLKAALKFVGKLAGKPRVVFLDPDTGLAPQKAGVTHVTDAEAKKFWSALAPRDVLVLYQHKTNRKGAPWIEEKRKQLALAIATPLSCVKIARGESIAHDVVFYFASKG